MWNKKLGKVFTSAVCVGLAATMLAGCGKAKEEVPEPVEAAAEEESVEAPAADSSEENVKEDSFAAEEYEDDFFDKLLFYPVNDVYGARVPKQNFIKLMKNYSVNCYYRFDENGKLSKILGIYYS